MYVCMYVCSYCKIYIVTMGLWDRLFCNSFRYRLFRFAIPIQPHIPDNGGLR